MNDEAATRETIYVVYVPYLPLSSRLNVGMWELIPRGELRDDDARNARDALLARGLGDLFALPEGTLGAVGAFAKPRRGCVGDDPLDGGPMLDLHRALTVAALDGNQSPLLDKARGT